MELRNKSGTWENNGTMQRVLGEWDESPKSSELQSQRASISRDAAIRAARAGPQMSFQKQPNPPSLIHKDTADDPFVE
ncbi:unnamed protein product [Cylicostephanus goldi]|uniref:Uncharacterized protein n=1 Tax=Cylicostephanus goldi TaxID=71465 RepID=A0A3P6PVS4_CYLGO|nr:unnamed protein product [Cylicostephanus goldi]